MANYKSIGTTRSKMCDIFTKAESEKAADTSDEPQDLIHYDDIHLSLFDMPVEIFLNICAFLDADFISKTLSKVCQRFEDILADNSLWRSWVSRRIKHRYPALPHLALWEEGEPNWEEACVDMDREMKKWRNVEKTMNHIVVKDVHFASVDSVLLVNDGELCLSGGRDRGLALWKVSALRHQDSSQACINSRPAKLHSDAHLGWVWDLAANSETNATIVYSASWDNTVKAWDLATNLECIETFKCGMSALSVVTNANLVLAGLYSRKILTFDIRAGPNAVDSYKVHKGPVLALDTYGDCVASASEDRTLAIWDRRAGKTLARDILLTGKRAYPVCLSWSAAALYMGDSKGSLHLVDPEQYVHRSSHRLWPEPESTAAACKVTGIHQSLGSLLVCTDQGEIKCLYPSDPPQEYTSIRSATTDITQLQYQNNILVVATCDSALEFWIPTETHDEVAA